MSADPAPPSPLPGDNHPSEEVGATGLPTNVAAALAVMIPLVGGLVFLFLERKDRFVRFYCVQSIVLGVLLGAAYLILSLVELIFLPMPFHIGTVVIYMGRMAYGIFAIVWFVLYFTAMIKAFGGKIWAIPYLGPMAKRYLASKGS